jgi:hypothetical protein
MNLKEREINSRLHDLLYYLDTCLERLKLLQSRQMMFEKGTSRVGDADHWTAMFKVLVLRARKQDLNYFPDLRSQRSRSAFAGNLLKFLHCV